MMTRTQLHLRGLRLHRALLWVAAIALISFCLSGLLHPLMTWTGPRAAAYQPPRATFSVAEIKRIPHILKHHGIERAQIVKLLPSEHGNVLQVTTSATQPRRYFRLNDLAEISQQDEHQARWLAEYYSGRSVNDIASISLQTAFDNNYPWINRLLPVYRVQFRGEDNLTLYLHTELNAMVSISNNWRASLQNLFAWLHTWSWLDNVNVIRIIFMLTLLVSLALMTAAGITLLIASRKRTLKSRMRRWHRRTGWLVSLPLLAFIVSGSWHLLHHASTDAEQASDVAKTPSLVGLTALTETNNKTGTNTDNTARIKTPTNITSLSLLAGPEGKLFYRLGFPNKGTGHHNHNHQAIDVNVQPSALYVEAKTLQASALNDEQFVRFLAKQSQPETTPMNAARLNAFVNGYNFRNKRLPVWQLSYDTGETVFWDPLTGMRIDAVATSARTEGWVFSNFHKWNGLTPISGRGIRDVLISACILVIIGLMFGGVWLSRNKTAR